MFLHDFYEEIKDRVPVKLPDPTVHRDLSEELTFHFGWKGFRFGLNSATSVISLRY